MFVDHERPPAAGRAAWVALWCSIAALHVALVVLFLCAPQSLAFAIVVVLALLVWIALGLA